MTALQIQCKQLVGHQSDVMETNVAKIHFLSCAKNSIWSANLEILQVTIPWSFLLTALVQALILVNPTINLCIKLSVGTFLTIDYLEIQNKIIVSHILPRKLDIILINISSFHIFSIVNLILYCLINVSWFPC